MLQHIISSAPARRTACRPLMELFRKVQLSMVAFTAQDIYQICATATHSDAIGMMQDAEFMRGLSAAFERSDQTVLSPFQINVVTEVFTKVGLHVKPNEVAVPDEEMISPESLLNVLKTMHSANNRNESHIRKITGLMVPLLPEFSPVQLSQTLRELSFLKCSDISFMSAIARRACQVADDLSPPDICMMCVALTYSKVPQNILREVFEVAGGRLKEFNQEDYLQMMNALNAGGPKYLPTLKLLVEEALEHVENMDAETLTQFLVCFVSMEYRDREHIDIFVDSLVEKICELSQRPAIHAFQAVHQLNLMTAEIFELFTSHFLKFAHIFDPRNIISVIDVCSQVPFRADELMNGLMDRITDCVHVFTARQLGDILEVLSTYPPAREHRLVSVLGKQCKRRMDLLGPTPLAQAVRGLAMLGFPDTDFYTEVCTSYQRWGFKDFSQLEPVLIGLCINANAEVKTIKQLSTHLTPMATQMGLPEVERANRYMVRLNCEDEWVYKALADRVRVFVKEITPEMPQDLQLLLQKGASVQVHHHHDDHRRRHHT